MRRAVKYIVLVTALGLLALIGLLIYGLYNPAYVYRDVSIVIPVPADQVLSESLALELGQHVLDDAGLLGKVEPFPDDRLENGNQYLFVSESGRGTLMFHSNDYGRRFLHIELSDGIAQCELWRSK
ncbi:MAG: hypothetical protein AB8F26_10105 [Phycisphaerales bacterium]